MRHRIWMWSAVLILAAALAGCGATKKESSLETTSDSLVAANPAETGQGDITPQEQLPPPPAAEPAKEPAPQPERRHEHPPAPQPAPQPQVPSITVPSGTAVKVTLASAISSETAQVGDSWTGVVKDAVVIDGRTVIPAGSTVSGTVTAAKDAAKGDRAMLDFGMATILVEGHTYAAHGTTQEIVAGSTRARNVGAIAGGAAAGALIGRAVGGSGKGALIGGLLGGAAAGGAVAKSKGYQVVLKEGTELVFTTSEAVAVREGR
ncbi:MAG: hypothetical protein HZC42_14430 [Candidatus Eisenbacteria bacterium]|nr:hypothetical protein [Candidatus Eisenbacteria bacterium]